MTTKLTRNETESLRPSKEKKFKSSTPLNSDYSDSSSDYSMLNYLIGRLNEQHKTKLSPALLPVDGEDLTTTKAKINSDFKAFEQQLFEKYALPPSGEDEHMNEDNDELRLLVDTAPPLNDTSYVLTRSLYASHKQINLADTAVEADNTKLITALSINEIETRRSFVSDGIDIV